VESYRGDILLNDLDEGVGDDDKEIYGISLLSGFRRFIRPIISKTNTCHY
jgi:hypothetical protein